MKIKTYYEPLYKVYVTAFIEPDQKKAQAQAEKIIKDTLELNM